MQSLGRSLVLLGLLLILAGGVLLLASRFGVHGHRRPCPEAVAECQIAMVSLKRGIRDDQDQE